MSLGHGPILAHRADSPTPDDRASGHDGVVPVEITSTERPRAFVLSVDGRPQSAVDLDDPTRLDFDYVRRIADVVDAAGEPGARLRVLHVGGGAMTLARYVAHTRPTSPQVVLEPAADVLDAVRRALPLPPRSGIKVRPVDGRAGLSGLRDDSWDVVVVDAFADGRVPGELVTAECCSSYSRVLGADGLLVLNLVDAAPFAWTRRAVAAVRTAFPALMVNAEPATVRARRPGNLLLVAGPAALPVPALRARVASGSAPYRVFAGSEVSDRFGGGTPFSDADTEPSPPEP
jgi:spermidine synthase